MIIHDVEQGTPEWHTIRLGKLTASQAQAIATAGKGLETLVYKKVAEKLTGKADDGYTNANMERGNELEAMARNAYELESGNVVDQVGFCELDEYCGASPDGLIGGGGLVEIKCKSDPVFVKELLASEIDPAHVWQMQMQMFVTGRKWCDYAVFNPDFPQNLIVKRVERDEVAIDKIRAGVETGKAIIKSTLLKITNKYGKTK